MLQISDGAGQKISGPGRAIIGLLCSEFFQNCWPDSNILLELAWADVIYIKSPSLKPNFLAGARSISITIYSCTYYYILSKKKFCSSFFYIVLQALCVFLNLYNKNIFFVPYSCNFIETERLLLFYFIGCGESEKFNKQAYPLFTNLATSLYVNFVLP